MARRMKDYHRTHYSVKGLLNSPLIWSPLYYILSWAILSQSYVCSNTEQNSKLGWTGKGCDWCVVRKRLNPIGMYRGALFNTILFISMLLTYQRWLPSYSCSTTQLPFVHVLTFLTGGNRQKCLLQFLNAQKMLKTFKNQCPNIV